MRTWLNLHAAALGDSFRRLVYSPLATLLSVVVIGVALSLPAGLYLGLSGLQATVGQLARDPQVTLFLELDASAADAANLKERLQAHPDVQSVRFIAKDDALAELRRRTGLGDVLDSLGQNPLPDAFVVTAKDNHPQALERLREAAGRWPKVAQVTLDSAWARRLEAGLRVGRVVTLLLSGLLSAALVAVTFNTIRLQILSRREEIEVAKLIGATNGFIRRPFLYLGLLQGLGGGLVAWAIVSGAVWILHRNLADLVENPIFFHGVSAQFAVAMVGASGALGGLGAWLSVTRHLWQIEPK
jgi:cell division transport system permease protein